MAINVFNTIKKQNGETFAKAIRNYDNGIFDVENIDAIVKYAGRDAQPILWYLESLKDIKVDLKEALEKPKDPFSLLSEAWYTAEYADTLEKQNSIEKYFEPNEKLCTFNDRGRYKNYYIVNAVKKDVDNIKRKSFKHPAREDKYGRSVISIQMLKRGGFISIKNRYNHTVQSPDNTFWSNPDNIIKGLGNSLKEYFNVDFSSTEQELPNGFAVVNGKLIKYIYEINNVYFANKFYIKDGNIITPPSHHIMMDYFIYDNKEQEIIDIADLSISIDDEKKRMIREIARLRAHFTKDLTINMNLELHELVDRQIKIFQAKCYESALIMKTIISKENKGELSGILQQLLDNELYDFISYLPERFPKDQYAKDLVACLVDNSRSAAYSLMHYIGGDIEE